MKMYSKSLQYKPLILIRHFLAGVNLIYMIPEGLEKGHIKPSFLPVAEVLFLLKCIARLIQSVCPSFI